MVKIAKTTEVTNAEAVALLREHIAALPPPPEPEFKPGDAVWLDNGCIGVVSGTDDEGNVTVYYIDHDGLIEGPSSGWRLTRLQLLNTA